MMTFTFLVLDHKYPWANLVQKFKLKFVQVKFVTIINSNMQNSVVVSILSVLDWT